MLGGTEVQYLYAHQTAENYDPTGYHTKKGDVLCWRCAKEWNEMDGVPIYKRTIWEYTPVCAACERDIRITLEDIDWDALT